MRRGSAVRIDVTNLLRQYVRLRERHLHDPDRATAVLGWGGDVVRVGRHPVADELGIDLRAALQRHLALFEHEDARAFTDDEAVALFVEWPARLLRFVIARRHS